MKWTFNFTALGGGCGVIASGEQIATFLRSDNALLGGLVPRETVEKFVREAALSLTALLPEPSR